MWSLNHIKSDMDAKKWVQLVPYLPQFRDRFRNFSRKCFEAPLIFLLLCLDLCILFPDMDPEVAVTTTLWGQILHFVHATCII